jgi:translation initiation factor IF-3
MMIAREIDLDLVEVAPLANPPVCRIMDYGKFKFDEAQRAKESRRKSTNVSLKEMKYRLKIGPGDFDTKTRKVAGFLADGHKVKITIMFRGREVERPQYGKQILDRVADKVAEVGKVEMMPRLDGRNMVMVMAPDKRAQAAAQAAARQAAAELGSHDDSAEHDHDHDDHDDHHDTNEHAVAQSAVGVVGRAPSEPASVDAISARPAQES